MMVGDVETVTLECNEELFFLSLSEQPITSTP